MNDLCLRCNFSASPLLVDSTSSSRKKMMWSRLSRKLTVADHCVLCFQSFQIYSCFYQLTCIRHVFCLAFVGNRTSQVKISMQFDNVNKIIFVFFWITCEDKQISPLK